MSSALELFVSFVDVVVEAPPISVDAHDEFIWYLAGTIDVAQPTPSIAAVQIFEASAAIVVVTPEMHAHALSLDAQQFPILGPLVATNDTVTISLVVRFDSTQTPIIAVRFD